MPKIHYGSIGNNNRYQAVNLALVRRNWLMGRRIAEKELNGEERGEYGLNIIKSLSKKLTDEYGEPVCLGIHLEPQGEVGDAL